MPKPALYPAELRAALARHVHLPVRSEMQRNLQQSLRYLDLFVDAGQLSLVKNPDWQVIYGRRGTGKTLLLSVLREETEKTFDTQRILSLQLTLQDCLVSPMGRQIADRQRALGYFQTFIELLATELSSKVDYLLGKPEFMAKLTGAHIRRRRQIEECTIEILELCQVGKPVKAFGTRSDSTDVTLTTEEHVTTSAAATLDVSVKEREVGLGIDASASADRRMTEARVVHEDSAPIPRFAMVRRTLTRLLGLLEVTHLNILLDEWQTLDPHGSSGIQPEFAEYLKRTLAGSPSVSIKIATNRYQTRFNNTGKGPHYRGFELGADLFEATNLDRLDLSDDEQVAFYSTLLFRRLLHCNPELSVLDPDGDGVPEEQFIFEMFKSRRAFETLIKGAAATPRDFLLLFNTLAKERQFSVEPLWSAEMVNDAIREGVAVRLEETDPNSEADQLLSECVRPIVEATGSRLFLVDRDDRGVINGGIEELIEKRLIDQVPGAELAPEIATRYDAFLLHYGLWLGWRHPHQATNAGREEIPAIRQDNAMKFVAALSAIDRGLINCPHCGDVFNPMATRSYAVAGLCPQCFKQVRDIDTLDQ